MDTKNYSINQFLIYFFVGFLFGFIFTIMSIRVASASSSDLNYMITEYKLQQKKGYEFIVLYDTDKKTYRLIEYTDKNAYFTDDEFFINDRFMGGYYIWRGNVWEAYKFGVNNYTPLKTEYLLYSSSNLKNEKGGIYFYKTNSIITNSIYHGISTELVQKISSTIKVLIPIFIFVIISFISINLILKIIYKFL